jgi:hypothetical protein
MSLFASYSSSLAANLLPLLDPAGTIPVGDAWVPSPFNLVTTFTTAGGTAAGVQGLVLAATLPINGSNTQVSILVFSARWADFLYGSYTTNFTTTAATPSYLNLGVSSAPGISEDVDLMRALADLRASLAQVDNLSARTPGAEKHPLVALARSAARLEPLAEAPTADSASVATGLILLSPYLMYGNARAAVWSSLAALYSVPGYGSTFPILCVGYGPAALVAQLAALDLRPGQTGPAGMTQKSPASDIGCYAFSVAPLGDATFTPLANKAVSGSYPVNATGTDLWPVPLGLPAGLQTLGSTQSVSAVVPSTADTPWYDRTPAVYGQAFGYGPPTPAGAGTLGTQPTGFDPRLAAALARLNISTYALCQHPSGSVTVPAPYQVIASVSPSGQSWTNLPWAVLYKNPATNALVIAIRGPTTIVETGTANGSGYPTRPSWLNTGRISDGVLDLASLLAAPLATALAGQPAYTSVYYTGHDYGASAAGVLAYQAKAQVLTNLPVPSAIYGFGCQPFGDYVFTNTVYPPLLGTVTYQVQRPSDVLTMRTGSGYTYVVGAPVSLSGGEISTANSTSYHAAALYAQLLNAWAS